MRILNDIYQLKLVLVFIGFFSCNLIYSQATTSVIIHQDSVLIGDPIDIEVKISFPIDAKITNIDLSNLRQCENLMYLSDTIFLDKYGDLAVLDFGEWKHDNIDNPINVQNVKIIVENGKNVISNKIKVAFYNMGVFRINAPILNLINDVQVLNGESPTIVVMLPEKILQQDSVAFNPIKGILYEEANLSDFMIYIYILIGLLLMGLLAYYFSKLKSKQAETPVDSPIEKLPAHITALNALNELEAQTLWQKGLIKEYQTQLTQIIRQYLGNRYNLTALEMTTDETIASFVNISKEKSLSDQLKEILQIADLVKFAKAKPGEDIHSRFMIIARDFVHQTKEKEELS